MMHRATLAAFAALSMACAPKRQAAHVAELEATIDALQQESERLRADVVEAEELAETLRGALSRDAVAIRELSGKVHVALDHDVLFGFASYELTPEGEAAVARVAEVLARVTDREIRVEGHTDAVKVTANAPYPDNWALSALRASAVVATLVEHGVDPLAVAPVGHGEFMPVADNRTDAGRAANRRIDVVLVPRLARSEALVAGR